MNQTKPKKTPSNKPDYQPILSHLKLIDYIRVHSLVKTWLTDNVVGFNVSASSLIRKRKTIERVASEINNYELPLLVDEGKEGYSSFRLMIKV